MKVIGLVLIGLTLNNPFVELLAGSGQAWKKYQAGREPLVEFLITIAISILLVILVKFIYKWYNRDR